MVPWLSYAGWIVLDTDHGRHLKGQQNFIGQNSFQAVEMEKLEFKDPRAAVK